MKRLIIVLCLIFGFGMHGIDAKMSSEANTSKETEVLKAGTLISLDGVANPNQELKVSATLTRQLVYGLLVLATLTFLIAMNNSGIRFKNYEKLTWYIK